ncbi:MAG: hypothetical protein GY943_21615 [Chloroflexi bacterium]|nr:hypothetical protein [Chloroflexota bacterium]
MTVKGYAKFESRFMRRVLKNPLMALGMHWVFQSLFYMDSTERNFKLALDAGGTLAIWALLQQRLPKIPAFLLAFIIAHSANLLANGHLWGVLKHYGFVEHSYEAFEAYSQALATRVQAENSIAYGAIYGSRVRAEWKPSSDLDVRLVRQPGFVQGIRASWFVLRERSRATRHRFPLDLYVLDSHAPLDAMRDDERPFVICDR